MSTHIAGNPTKQRLRKLTFEFANRAALLKRLRYYDPDPDTLLVAADPGVKTGTICFISKRDGSYFTIFGVDLYPKNDSIIEFVSAADREHNPEIECVYWDEWEDPEDPDWLKTLRRQAAEGRVASFEPFVYDIPASNHSQGSAIDISAPPKFPKIKRCGETLARKIKLACKRNDLRVGQLIHNAARDAGYEDPFYIPDAVLADYISDLERRRRERDSHHYNPTGL